MSIYKVDSLSISKIGELLIEQLGDDAANYTFPEDFEKAIVDIGFKGIVLNGNTTPYDVIVIGDSLYPNAFFENATSSTLVKSVRFIGDNQTALPERAFYGQDSLTTIEVPESVTFVGTSCFYNCTNLEKVKFNGTELTFQEAAFQDCNNLKTAGVGSQYDIEFAAGTTAIPNLRQTNMLETLVIPDGATAFVSCYLCTNLSSITIPDSVTKLGSLYQTAVTSVVANNATSFDALNKMASLQNLVLPKCVYFGNNAFDGNTSMTTVQLGSIGYPVTNISVSAFSACSQAGLTITVYCADNYISTAIANIRNRATNATIVVKAAVDMVYDGASYQAGDTVVTSTP